MEGSSQGSLVLDVKFKSSPAAPLPTPALPKPPTSRITSSLKPKVPVLSPQRNVQRNVTAPTLVSPIIGNEKLLSFDRANDVINTLVATVNSQQLQIQALQQHQSRTVERSELNNIAKTLTNGIKALDDRVSRLENHTKLTCRDPESIGHVVNSNRRAIARSLDVISSKVSKTDLENLQEALNLSISSSHDSLKETLASRSTMDKAVDVVSSMSQKVQALERVIQGKVDNTDFDAVRMDAEVVREKARELNGLLTRLSHLEEVSLSAGGRLTNVEDVSVKNENRTMLILEGLKGKAGKGEFDELKKGVERVVGTVEKDKPDRKELNRVESVLGSQGSKLESLTSAIRSITLTSSTLESKLVAMEKDTVKQGEYKRGLGSSVSKATLSDTVARIKAELDAKSWNKDVSNLKRMVATQSKVLGNAKRKADLAGEFVEWYMKKGEVMEGNLNAVDRHLEKLAIKARAEERGETGA